MMSTMNTDVGLFKFFKVEGIFGGIYLLSYYINNPIKYFC